MIVVLVLEAAWIGVINSSICLFLDEVEALQPSLWEGLAVGKTGSCSGGQSSVKL